MRKGYVQDVLSVLECRLEDVDATLDCFVMNFSFLLTVYFNPLPCFVMVPFVSIFCSNLFKYPLLVANGNSMTSFFFRTALINTRLHNQIKFPAPEVEPGYDHPSTTNLTRSRTISFIVTNDATTKLNHHVIKCDAGCIAPSACV